jgi:hypothetical protein
MGKKSGVQFVVLVEDRELERFVVKSLTSLGYARAKIRVRRDYPRGANGSGKHYVNIAYPKEVRTLRGFKMENRALVVGTDADEQTTEERHERLAETLRAAGLEPRGNRETVAHWIPKWHVETWGLHLTGTEVDEHTSYKRRAAEINWKAAARQFAEEFHQTKHGQVKTLPSLLDAYKETGRLGA